MRVPISAIHLANPGRQGGIYNPALVHVAPVPTAPQVAVGADYFPGYLWDQVSQVTGGVPAPVPVAPAWGNFPQSPGLAPISMPIGAPVGFRGLGTADCPSLEQLQGIVDIGDPCQAAALPIETPAGVAATTAVETPSASALAGCASDGSFSAWLCNNKRMLGIAGALALAFGLLAVARR